MTLFVDLVPVKIKDYLKQLRIIYKSTQIGWMATYLLRNFSVVEASGN